MALIDKYPKTDKQEEITLKGLTHAYMLRFKSNIWLLQEDVDMTGPAGHLQMELCSLNRKSCRHWNLVPAFIKFRSSHLHSTDDFPQRRWEWKELLALTMREQCFMNPLQSSETMSTGKIHKNPAKGKGKSTYYIILGSFLFLSGYTAQQHRVLGYLSCKVRLWESHRGLTKAG